jgi:hypothetical protein
VTLGFRHEFSRAGVGVCGGAAPYTFTDNVISSLTVIGESAFAMNNVKLLPQRRRAGVAFTAFRNAPRDGNPEPNRLQRSAGRARVPHGPEAIIAQGAEHLLEVSKGEFATFQKGLLRHVGVIPMKRVSRRHVPHRKNLQHAAFTTPVSRSIRTTPLGPPGPTGDSAARRPPRRPNPVPAFAVPRIGAPSAP